MKPKAGHWWLNGGYVEVSTGSDLIFTGTVSTLAPNGLAGRLIIDPTDRPSMTISDMVIWQKIISAPIYWLSFWQATDCHSRSHKYCQCRYKHKWVRHWNGQCRCKLLLGFRSFLTVGSAGPRIFQNDQRQS